MNHAVNTPMMAPPIILAQLIALVVASILSPLLAIAASRVPMKIWIISFGVTIAVARANIEGLTVSKVEIAPLEIEYGNGQSLIIHRSLRPSCLSTKESAVNLESFSTSRWTNLESKVRETKNEHSDPTTVADATMNQLVELSVNSEYRIKANTWKIA